MSGNNSKRAKKKARHRAKREKKKASRREAQARRVAELRAKERALSGLLGAEPLIQAVQAYAQQQGSETSTSETPSEPSDTPPDRDD